MGENTNRCVICDVELPPQLRQGRPKRYCSSAHRQKDYMSRKLDEAYQRGLVDGMAKAAAQMRRLTGVDSKEGRGGLVINQGLGPVAQMAQDGTLVEAMEEDSGEVVDS